jgi:hypothetical protein
MRGGGGGVAESRPFMSTAVHNAHDWIKLLSPNKGKIGGKSPGSVFMCFAEL